MMVWKHCLSIAHSLQSVAALMRPVLIMMVWKHCLSIAHSLQSVAALIVAVLWQLYRIASSPNNLPADMTDRNLPSLDTSTLRSSITYTMLPISPSLMIREPFAYSIGYIQSTISFIWEVSKFFMKSLSMIAALMRSCALSDLA